ncbi:sensor histidine kinase [Streptomyces parvus]|uniref:sensor histidine kinase n=1 Tax=Streptomyces parvus TaxID=66428 RepID=UPI003D71BA67
MFGRVRGWRRGWHERTKLQRIDLYTRGTLAGLPWVFLVSWGLLPLLPVLGEGPARAGLAVAFFAVNTALCVLSNRDLGAAFAHHRGTEPFPMGRLRLPAALLALLTGLMVALAATADLKDAGLALLVLDMPLAFAIPYVLLVPVRTYLVHSAGYAVVLVALLAAVGVPAGLLFGAVLSMLVAILLVLSSVRPSAWSMSVMWQAEEARDMQARLAVAEERLRFGRDMHDVLGRNLSVIALKSELAVELAQRGNPAAVDQMVEVQRIARASQQEVRDVVRGYREADLPTELMGARGVLQAAGISVTVEGADGPAGIGAPAAVQAALGWVVRETATNVLRHGDPRHCSIRLTRTRDAVVLEVENDGAGAADPLGGGGDGGGSGLAGLSERLGALGGSLTAGPVGDDPDLFRVTATVPLTASGPGGRTASDPGGRTASAGGGHATGDECAAGDERATGDEHAALGERTASGERATPSAPPASPSPDPSALPEER